MIWVLFFIAVVVSSAIFVWDFRRKARAREEASRKRFEEMFAARAPGAAAAPAAAETVAPAVSAAPKAAPPTQAAAVPAAPPDGRFLGKAHTLAYRLLKAGIPDHEVFANVALASVVVCRNEQEARRLSPYRIDFVVCDKEMKVVAAVELETAGGAQAAGEQRFKADALRSAGVGLVRINVAALPRRDDIRVLVLGRPGG